MQLAAPVSPVDVVFNRYAPAMLMLPGTAGAGWSAGAGDVITVRTQSSELALLADRVLADTIEGVRLVVTAPEGGGEVPADSWVRSAANVVRVMASLPGVVEWTRFGGYTLLADSHERAGWLRALVAPEVDGIPVRVMTRADLP